MTYLQMKCFLSLANTRKMSITATAMDVSLSTLSKYMDKMESELSVKLFSKDQHKLTLTREGELALPSIEYIVKQYDEQSAEMDKYRLSDTTTIRIALAFYQKEIIQGLITFMKTDLNVSFDIIEVPANEVCMMLDSGEADIGIVYEELIDKKYPVILPIWRDKVVAVLSKKHPLSERDVISVRDLRGEKFYFFKGDYLMYHYQLRMCISAGFVPLEEQSDLRASTILKYVEANCGVTLFTLNTVATLGISGVKAVDLEDNPNLTMCVIPGSIYPSNAVSRLLAFLDAGIGDSKIRSL